MTNSQYDGNAAQVRLIGEQIAEAVIVKYHESNRHAEIPAPLKWAAGIVAALMTALVTAMAFWLASTVNDMQITLGRMEERMAATGNAQEGRIDDLSRRVSRLEAITSSGDNE